MGRKKNKNKDKNKNDDFEMRATSPPVDVKQLGKKKKKKNKKNSLVLKIQMTQNKGPWYLVRVRSGGEIPAKEFLLESFAAMLDEAWTMYGYHQETSAKFYVEGHSVAAAIEGLSRRIKGVDGSLLTIQSQPCKHFLLLNSDQISTLKQVLASRFNADLQLLDLSKLHSDPRLVSEDILAVLCDPDVLKQVLTQVRSNLPQLKLLSLSHNRLSLEAVKTVCSVLKELPLQAINLEQNQITNVRDLVNSLSVFSSTLGELKLEGNHCIKDIKNETEYIKAVRKRLTGLKVLDGVTIDNFLAKVGGQSSQDGGASGGSTGATSLTETLVNEFLKEFYSCLDGDRSSLLKAYTPDANFGIDSPFPFIQSGKGSGSAVVAEGMAVLPPCKHLLDTFAVEKVALGPSLAQYIVRGKAQLQGNEAPCDFAHSFAIVPYLAGVGCSTSVFEYR